MAKSKLITLQKTYQKRIDSLISNHENFGNLVSLLQHSDDNYVAQKRREENKIYDEQWINSLETGFEALDMIVKNPRTFIKEDAQVVLAALAKKITAQSVQDLAMHSEYVHNIDSEGNVTPDKILSISTEEDYQIYENRFVMTLIKKLVIFIERRYKFIKDHGETTNSDVLLIHNVTTIDGVTYECDNRIKVSRPSDDNGQKEHNAELLAKILRLRDRASFYLHCPFMHKMAGAKPVHNPLSMTNMLLKSPTYHKAYELWKFIDSYEKLGITYSVKETNQEFDDTYYQEIYGLVMGDILTLNSHQIDTTEVASSLSKKKILTPRVMLMLDDETFLDGKFTYHEFPQPDDNKKREKGTMAPQKEDLDKIKIAEQKRLFDEKKKAEEIAAKQAEWKRKQDLKEAVAAAAKRKKLEAQLAKIIAAQKALAKKMEAERLAKEKAAAEKARQEQIKLEAQLLEKTRQGVKREASSDKELDAAELARLERERQKAIALEAKRAAAEAAHEKEEAALRDKQAKEQAALEAALALAKEQEEAAKASAEASSANAKLHIIKLRTIKRQKFVPILNSDEAAAPKAALPSKRIKVAPVLDSDKLRKKGNE
jgi:DNA repair protein SbcC/Rad50